MIILGIGGILGDAAAAVAKDGQLVAAVEEIKVSRQYRVGTLPAASIAACLAMAGAKPEEVDCVAVVRPFSTGPEENVHLQLRARFPNSRIVVTGHHRAHADSAFYASPFTEATVLTLDRAGDFRCGARWKASGSQISMEKEIYYPDSLGDLYGRVTELLGFKANADEHKVQWLSVNGDDRFRELFLEIMPANWARIDRSFIDSERMTHGGFSAKFFERLGVPDGGGVPESLRSHVAAGLQRALESTVLEMAGSGENLCLAGGLGFNALLVAALERSGKWTNVFVQPCAGNAGTALGAVFHAWHNVLGQTARLSMGNLCLGPSFSAEEIKQVLENCKLHFRYLLTADELIETAVAQINEHRIIAWMHGPHGVRAAGAGQSQHSGVAARSVFDRESQRVHQASGGIPEIRRVGSRGTGGGILRAGAECAVSGDSGPRAAEAPQEVRERDPRRRPDSRPHGFAGGQSALLEAAACGREIDRPAGALQHVVQSVRRSAGLHASRRRAQLLLIGDRCAVRGEFLHPEIEKAPACAGPLH